MLQKYFTRRSSFTPFLFLFFFSFFLIVLPLEERAGRAGPVFSPITLTFTTVNFQQRRRLPSSTSHPAFMKGGRRANYRQHSHVSRRWEATNLAVFRPSQHFFLPLTGALMKKKRKRKEKTRTLRLLRRARKIAGASFYIVGVIK